MNASFMEKHTKLAVLSSLLAAMFSLSAHAALYTLNYTDSGAIPQGGGTFSAEHTVSIADSSITSIEFILTFNDSSSLLGTSSGIQGHLILGTSDTSPFVNFYPTATSSSGAERIFDTTPAGLDTSVFNNLNPNDTWTLVLWDNSNTGIENGLVSWTLDITAVPEPVNVALGVFGLLFVGVGAARFYLARRRLATAS